MLAIVAALTMQAAPPAAAAEAPLPPAAMAVLPSPEALALAREIADAGVLATLLPMLVQKDLDELAAERPDLTAEQRRRLIATGRQIAARHRETALQAMAVSYAKRLSLADLKTLAAASRTAAAKAKRAADLPATIMAMTMLGSVDFKRETAAAFCAETGALCARR